MIVFDSVPYASNESEYWADLGMDSADYHGQLDAISDLMVSGSDDTHLAPVLLAAEGINQINSGHAPAPSCVAPMAELARELGDIPFANRADAVLEQLNIHPDLDSHAIIYDGMLIFTDETPANHRPDPDDKTDYLKKFADWLKTTFPRVEVPDLATYLEEKWTLVRLHHPAIWQKRQSLLMAPLSRPEQTTSLFEQIDFAGFLTLNGPFGGARQQQPISYKIGHSLEGQTYVVIRFSDAISLIDYVAWREVARVAVSTPDTASDLWTISARKQFMIDLDTRTISEPRFLRPLPQKLIYLD